MRPSGLDLESFGFYWHLEGFGIRFRADWASGPPGVDFEAVCRLPGADLELIGHMGLQGLILRHLEGVSRA